MILRVFTDLEMPTEGTNNEASTAEIQGPSSTFTSNFPPPSCFHLKGNFAKNWKNLKQVWDAYETITNLNGKESKFHVVTFIHTYIHTYKKT